MNLMWLQGGTTSEGKYGYYIGQGNLHNQNILYPYIYAFRAIGVNTDHTYLIPLQVGKTDIIEQTLSLAFIEMILPD